MVKRSSCDSGSGKVPTCSEGFCVAMTKKGVGSLRVSPSAVTWCSSIASSSADWVLGVARFTSSARITCAKIGPGWKLKAPLSRPYTETPMISAGSMSLVNWMRWNCRPSERVRKRGLAHAGQVFDQQVAARQQAGKRQAHLRFLAEDDAARGLDYALDRAAAEVVLGLEFGLEQHASIVLGMR